MYDSEYNKQGKGAGNEIAAKHHHKDEVSEKIERFAGKSIEQITGKRTDAECRHRITGKHDTDSRVSGLEKFG